MVSPINAAPFEKSEIKKLLLINVTIEMKKGRINGYKEEEEKHARR